MTTAFARLGPFIYLIASVCMAFPPPDSYYTDEAARRLVHFDKQSGECKLFGDRRIVDEIVRELAASESPVAIVEVAELTAIISHCSVREHQDKRSSQLRDFPHIIYPGTKWCGTGNVAEGPEDLGSLKSLDRCCRNHDLCTDLLEPGESRHNLTNESSFPLSPCSCNDKFRSCLKNVKSSEATDVGTIYFSSGLFQCYTLSKPIMGCKEWSGSTCQEYVYDDSGELKYQVMDMKSFE